MNADPASGPALAADPSAFTIQVGRSVLGRSTTPEGAIAIVADHFAAQVRAACRILGRDAAWWAAHTAPRVIRHAGRTVARIAPQADGGYVVEGFEAGHAGRPTGRRASRRTVGHRSGESVGPADSSRIPATVATP